MWPDRVSNPGPLTYESDALPTALRGPPIFGMWELAVYSEKSVTSFWRTENKATSLFCWHLVFTKAISCLNRKQKSI